VPSTPRLPALRIGAVVAIGIAAGLGIWLATRDQGSSSPAATSSNIVPISASGLQTLVGALHRPIYWAGVQRGRTYELTQSGNGDIYVRYLPQGTKIGTKQPYLTVGTYPVADALGLISRGAARSGSVRVPFNGGAAYYSSKDPHSVYLAVPGANYEIEVFDPSAAEARRLVKSGKIVAVVAAAAPAARTTLVTQAQLASTAKNIGHPVYWAGPKSGISYELKETPGRTYVRYLPPGTKAGANLPALTVGTYVVPHAFSVTQQQAAKPDAVQVPVTGGGIAFYGKSAPTSVYVAFPGKNVQIEVYDPSGHASSFVTSGKIVAVS
jgi:hypothetical protein